MVAYSKVCDYDVVAYREYLRASVCEQLYRGSSGVDVRAPGGVFDLRVGDVDGVGRGNGVAGGVRCGTGEASGLDGGVGGSTQSVESESERDEGVEGQVWEHGASGAASGGVVESTEGDSGSGEHLARGVSDGSCEVVGARLTGPGGSEPVGKHHARNKAKREKQKMFKQRWGAVGETSGASVAASVQTVDTRTGVEIEAAQTLAARRVEENKVKIAEAKVAAKLAEHRLKALNDRERSVAIDRLAAARLEEKINTARSKSQESFKKCDESLKSLGSMGSAGEFALKMQIKDAKDNEQVLKFVRQQVDYMSKHVSPEVLEAMSRHIKPPVIQEEFDAFGDCPSDYDEDECEAYYNELNRRNDKMAMFEAAW